MQNGIVFALLLSLPTGSIVAAAKKRATYSGIFKLLLHIRVHAQRARGCCSRAARETGLYIASARARLFLRHRQSECFCYWWTIRHGAAFPQPRRRRTSRALNGSSLRESKIVRLQSEVSWIIWCVSYWDDDAREVTRKSGARFRIFNNANGIMGSVYLYSPRPTRIVCARLEVSTRLFFFLSRSCSESAN